MNVIRKSTWTILILGAAAGCAGEEPTTAPATGPANPLPAVRPALPSAAPAGAAGETKKGDEAPKVEGPKADNAKSDAGAVKLTADELAAIKELPASEQELATKQLVCPVSSENLGSMGKPVKVTAEGRTFYLCCKSCQKELTADPKAVIAKLDKKGEEK
jgi:hypothetical protein